MTAERQIVALEPAYVLHLRPYRDSSAIIEAFTEQYGRVGLVGRGVRGQRSRLRGLLQPFSPLLLSWSGRGELVTLTGAEACGVPLRLAGPRVAAGFYLNELIIRLVRREDPHPELYPVYGDVLSELAGADDPEPALRLFEKRILEEIGYGLTLSHDAAGEPVVEDGWYEIRPEGLPVRLETAAGGTNVFRGRSLLALAAEHVPDPEAAAEAKRLLRIALRPHLGPTPLKSRELYRQLRAVGADSRDGSKGGHDGRWPGPKQDGG